MGLTNWRCVKRERRRGRLQSGRSNDRDCRGPLQHGMAIVATVAVATDVSTAASIRCKLRRRLLCFHHGGTVETHGGVALWRRRAGRSTAVGVGVVFWGGHSEWNTNSIETAPAATTILQGGFKRVQNLVDAHVDLRRHWRAVVTKYVGCLHKLCWKPTELRGETLPELLVLGEEPGDLLAIAAALGSR